jgi:putative tryptophan/tyrosine transport system substrate-binding protein
MVHSGDAVAAGIIDSLAKPGVNITGSTLLNPERMAKRLEFLKECLPSIARVAVLVNPDNALSGAILNAVRARGLALNVTAHQFDVRGPTELEGVFQP